MLNWGAEELENSAKENLRRSECWWMEMPEETTRRRFETAIMSVRVLCWMQNAL